MDCFFSFCKPVGFFCKPDPYFPAFPAFPLDTEIGLWKPFCFGASFVADGLSLAAIRC